MASWILLAATPASARATPDATAPDTVPRFDTETETTHRLVTWDDFQAEPSRPARGRRIRPGEGEQARIATAIRSDPFDVKVRLINRGYWVAVPLGMTFYAAMDKRSSGAGGGARTDLLLAHEQGHFDLTEIAARQLVRSLGGVEGQGTTGSQARAAVLEKIQQAHDRAVLELEEQQARYDQETSHGQSARGQRDWNDQIARMLQGTARSLLPLGDLRSPMATDSRHGGAEPGSAAGGGSGGG